MAMRVMIRDEADRMMKVAGEYHAGKRKLPDNIKDMRKKIDAAIANASLFQARLGVVDEGMVNEIVQMKLALDGMYGRWGIEG